MTAFAQFDKAFNRVAAYVVLKDGECVAKISIKFPADGAGRLYAYVHWLGVEMVRGSASGYGYDKRTAAVADAIRAMLKGKDRQNDWPYCSDNMGAFIDALAHDGGQYFDARLVSAGFTVIQAI